MQDLWPKGTRRSRFEQAAEEVRFQLGQSDRFREGVVRSGAWREHIAATFDEDGPAARAGSAAARRVLVQHLRLFQGRRRRHVAVHARHGPALPAHRRGGRRATRSVSLDRGRRALPGAELHRARQLAAGADRVQPRPRRHAARAGTARHQRHRRPSCASTTAARSASPRATSTSRSSRRSRSTAIPRSSSARSAAIRSTPAASSKCRTSCRRAGSPRRSRSIATSCAGSILRCCRRSGTARVTCRAASSCACRSTIDLTAVVEQLSGGERYDAQVAETQHRVRSGETLSTIATRYGVSIAAIAETQRPRPSLSNSCRPGAGVARRRGRDRRRRRVAQAEDRRRTAEGADAADRRRRHGESLRREARRHAVEDRYEARHERRGADGAEQHPQPQLRVRRPGAGAGRLGARRAAGRGGGAGGSRRVRAGARARRRSPKPPSRRPSARPKRSVRRWCRARRRPTSADPADYSVQRRRHDRWCRPPRRSATTPNGSTCARASCASLNRMSFATPVVVGRKVKLAFAKVTPDQFEARRMEYHRQLQEAFFTQFRIKDTTTHVIRRGESIWVLAQQRYNIPIWLLRQYNPDLDLGAIRPGTKLVIPIVEPTAPAEPGAGMSAAARRRSRSCSSCSGCMTAQLYDGPKRSARRGRAHQRRPALHRRLAADASSCAQVDDTPLNVGQNAVDVLPGKHACWSIAGLRRRTASRDTPSRRKSPPGDATDWSRRPAPGCGSAPQVTLQTVDF